MTTKVVATLVAALSFLALPLGAGIAQGATLEQIGTFEAPIYVTSDPGNPNRLFVVERAGRIEEVQGGSKTLFADLTSVVSCCGGEQGLLSIALAPDFDTSGRLFVDYIGKEGEPLIHVAELQASAGTVPLASLRQILEIPHPHQSNHYGGQLQFSPDGDLFISTGDGGGSNDQEHNAQSLSRPLGKILRLDPDAGSLLPYTVPADNPFASGTGWEPLVWSFGLRNPFRFSFDRDGSAMLIGDVGQGAREEVDRAPAPVLGRGFNYGWNCREGTIAGPATDPECTANAGTFTEPIFDYEHDVPPEGGSARCAIIGGYVVHDPGLPELDGRYIYGDNCSPWLRSIDPTAADTFPTDRGEGISVKGLTSFGEDSCGRIYAASGNGPVYRLVGSSPTNCGGTTGGGSGGATGGGGSTGTGGPSSLGSRIILQARKHAVARGSRAVLAASVSPCQGRAHETVTLLRGGRTYASRRLDASCRVAFHPRISRRSTYRASIGADATYLAAASHPLHVRITTARSR